MTQNPFEKFQYIPKSQEILDIAFSRASKKLKSPGTKSSHLVKARTKEYSRLKIVVEDMSQRLQSIIKSVPNLDEIPDFYRELAHLLVDNDELRLKLGQLQGILKLLRDLKKKYGYKIRTAKTPHEAEILRREVYGRISSIIEQQTDTLRYLDSVRKKLHKIPVLDTEFPAVVIAGYPNVGKSSLVQKISSGNPTVASYPFTTKEISIGILENPAKEDRFNRYHRLQIIDTPGILDRPMSTRNNIEKQAILAFRLLADAVVFIFDPTLTSGFELLPQLELFKEISETICEDRQIPILVVINKIDIATPEEIERVERIIPNSITQIFKINAMTGDYVEPLLQGIIEVVKTQDSS